MPDFVEEVLDSWGRVRPEVDTSSVAVTLRLVRAAAIVQARLDAVAATEEKLSHKGDLDTLTTLRRADTTLSAGDLAGAAQLTSGGMTNRLDRLEGAGLVERRPDPHDRRGIRVALTEAGRSVADRSFDRSLEAQRDVLAPLTLAEQRNLARSLQKLLEALGDDPIGLTAG